MGKIDTGIQQRVVAAMDEMNQLIKERSDVIKSVWIGRIAQEHVLMLGPGGTGKSFLARSMWDHIDGSTGGMASRERHDLIALVKRLVIEREISVLFTEHSMDVVFAYADRIIVLARGVLIADGNAAAIRDNAQVQAVYLGTGSTYRPHLEVRP